MADQPVAFGKIAEQVPDNARIERQKPLFAELALSHAQHAGGGVEIGTVERQRLADPQAGHRDQPEQCRAGQPTQAIDGRQHRGRRDDRCDLGIIVYMRSRPCDRTWQQALRGYFMRRIEAAQPLCEQAHSSEPRPSGRRAGHGQRGVPAQEQRGVDMNSAFAIGEPGEAAKDAFGGAKIVAEAAPDAEITAEFDGEAHCTPPATGQGCAIDRNPSMSRRAYIIVDVRERCRNTSPTSSSEAPVFTNWVARL